MGKGGVGLIVADLVASFMYVWSSALTKILVYRVMGFGHDALGEAVRAALLIFNMFCFAKFAMLTGGGTYNPITVLPAAVSGDFSQFLFTVGVRIPAQVMGSIAAVRFILETIPAAGHGPQLNIDIHLGALIEGLLTFIIVIIYLGLSRKIPGSFFMKTWISSVSKLTLHILGSDLTGGCMNPASVFGWAYARGDHITKEHIVVYWLAPIEATVLAVWAFKLLMKQSQLEEKEKLKKTD